MRRSLLLACASAGLASAMACAASESDAPADPPATSTPIPTDAEPVDGGYDAAEPKGPATCSDAGWCVTTLPDADLTLIDIWPFQARAFAVATSATLGVKVLEWTEAEHRWSYIDDNTQNDDGFGKYVGRIWAPAEEELYFAVAPGYVYHGKRTTTWTWERTKLPTGPSALPGDQAALGSPEAAALGVWGTAADDVYAWSANTIFHWKSVDGGTPEWVAEYVGADNNFAERVFVLSAGAASKDDVWFSGGRGNGLLASCPLVIRKTQNEYRHVVDGVFSYGPQGATCSARPEALHLDGVGTMTDIQFAGDDRFVALRYSDAVTRIAGDGDGGYVASSVSFTGSKPVGPGRTDFHSLWRNGDDVWLSGSGLVLRGPLDGEANTYSVSTIALIGAPLDAVFYRVRGTDNHNLWAIGDRYALHKTTP